MGQEYKYSLTGSFAKGFTKLKSRCLLVCVPFLGILFQAHVVLAEFSSLQLRTKVSISCWLSFKGPSWLQHAAQFPALERSHQLTHIMAAYFFPVTKRLSLSPGRASLSFTEFHLIKSGPPRITFLLINSK